MLKYWGNKKKIATSNWGKSLKLHEFVKNEGGGINDRRQKWSKSDFFGKYFLPQSRHTNVIQNIQLNNKNTRLRWALLWPRAQGSRLLCPLLALPQRLPHWFHLNAKSYLSFRNWNFWVSPRLLNSKTNGRNTIQQYRVNLICVLSCSLSLPLAHSDALSLFCSLSLSLALSPSDCLSLTLSLWLSLSLSPSLSVSLCWDWAGIKCKC